MRTHVCQQKFCEGTLTQLESKCLCDNLAKKHYKTISSTAYAILLQIKILLAENERMISKKTIRHFFFLNWEI